MKAIRYLWRCENLMAVFILLMAGALFSYNTLHFGLFDIGQWDESLYFGRARELNYLTADWGPVYSLFISPFRKILVDPIEAFDAYRLVLLFFLLPGGTYFLMRSLSGHRFVSIFSALGISTLTMIVTIDPGIQLFNFVIWIYLGGALFFVRRRPIVLFVIACVIGTLPFVRQDNTIWILLYGVGLAWLLYRDRQRTKSEAIIFSVAVAIAIVVFGCGWRWFGGSPFLANRALLAFADHYFWTHPNVFTVTAGLDRKQVVLQHFGNPATLSQLVLENFVTLLPHFGERFFDLIRMIREIFGRSLTPFVAVILSSTFIVIRQWRQEKTEKRIFTIVLLLVCGKAAALCVLLSPRPAYVVEPFLISILWATWVIYDCAHPKNATVRALTCLLVAAFFIDRSALLQKMVLEGGEARTAENLLSDRHYLEILRQTVRSDGEAILDEPLLATGQTSVFLGTNPKNSNVFMAVLATEHIPNYSFAKFVVFQKYRTVIIDNQFRLVAADHGLASDVAEFERDFTKFGFHRIGELPRQTYIYIRN